MQLMPRSWPVGDLAVESGFPTGGNPARGANTTKDGEDRTDQGRRGVAYKHEHVRSPSDAGRGFRLAPNGIDSSAVTELIRALRGIIPKPIAPRLTASTPKACDECIRQWGEYTQQGPAVDGGMMMRSCMTEHTFATVCYLANFATPRV